MSELSEIREALGSLRQYLEELRETGVDGMPFAAAGESPSPVEAGAKAPPEVAACVVNAPSAAAPPVTDVPLPPLSAIPVAEPVAAETLEAIRHDLGECLRCELGKTRTHLVFGVGNPHARLVFVGEAPGRDEDQQGEPFVGEAGQLLTKIIQGMGLQRSDVYICNVLKCRPPQNRDPKPDEVETCGPFMLRQVKAIGPAVIVALGKFAAQTLLNSKAPISKLRGQFHDYHGIPLMPTYHPAALLRDASLKREVWDDMKQVLKMLGMEVPRKK